MGNTRLHSQKLTTGRNERTGGGRPTNRRRLLAEFCIIDSKQFMNALRRMCAFDARTLQEWRFFLPRSSTETCLKNYFNSALSSYAEIPPLSRLFSTIVKRSKGVASGGSGRGRERGRKRRETSDTEEDRTRMRSERTNGRMGKNEGRQNRPNNQLVVDRNKSAPVAARTTAGLLFLLGNARCANGSQLVLTPDRNTERLVSGAYFHCVAHPSHESHRWKTCLSQSVGHFSLASPFLRKKDFRAALQTFGMVHSPSRLRLIFNENYFSQLDSQVDERHSKHPAEPSSCARRALYAIR